MRTIKFILIITINVIISMNSLSQTVGWDWGKNAGGGGDDSGYSICSNNNDDLILVGYFNNTAQFNDIYLNSLSFYGGSFITKLDTNGNFMWANRIAGTNSCYLHSVCTDNNNNIYVTGSFSETIYLDSLSFTSNGSADIIISKYNNEGILQWAKSAGGIGLDGGLSIVCSDSLLFVSGSYLDSVLFDTTLLISNGIGDIFIACLDFEGNYLWILSEGGAGHDQSRSICLDINSNIIISGHINTLASFGNSDTIINSYGSADAFIAKYSGNGAFKWAKSLGGIDVDRGISVISDSNNNLFLHGHFYGTAYFDSVTLQSSGDEDYFVCKLNANGEVLWAKKIEATVYPMDDFWNHTLESDEQGNMFVTGWFRDSLVYDDLTVQSNGSYDIFVMKIDTDGNLIWCLTAGNDHSYGDYSRSIARDGNGNLYITGRFYDTLFFGDSSVTSYGSADVFIAKIREEPVSVDKKKNSLEINVYPNPATDYINIGQTLQHIEKAEIIGINGDVVRSYDTDLDRLDVFGLAKGIYLLKLYAGNLTFVSKIVIQ